MTKLFGGDVLSIVDELFEFQEPFKWFDSEDDTRFEFCIKFEKKTILLEIKLEPPFDTERVPDKKHIYNKTMSYKGVIHQNIIDVLKVELKPYLIRQERVRKINEILK